MLEKRWNGGCFFRLVKLVHAVPSHSNVSDAAQTTTSLLRSLSNAALGVRQPAGVLATSISCQAPFWYCQKSANVVISSVPPYIQIVLLTGSVVKLKSDRGEGLVLSTARIPAPEAYSQVSATGSPTTGVPPNIVVTWRFSS